MNIVYVTCVQVFVLNKEYDNTSCISVSINKINYLFISLHFYSIILAAHLFPMLFLWSAGRKPSPIHIEYSF